MEWVFVMETDFPAMSPVMCAIAHMTKFAHRSISNATDYPRKRGF